MKKLLFIICCIVSVSYNANSQVISVKAVNHADTVQFADPFSLIFWFVNTGSTSVFADSITANIAINPVNTSPINWQILSISQNIPQGILAPGDSIFMLNTPLQGGSQLYQQAGGHVVIIWPSFVTPVIVDTSVTSLYVISSATFISEDIKFNIYNSSDVFYDILGRKIYNIINLPSGTMYFSRNGKRYIKL
jgi:hypothetical protein